MVPEHTLVVCNMTPVPRFNYRLGVPEEASGEKLSTAMLSNTVEAASQCGGVEAEPISWHGRSMSLSLVLPPLGVLFFEGTASNA
jgi:1,4-alpha-glucan branching enzyme